MKKFALLALCALLAVALPLVAGSGWLSYLIGVILIWSIAALGFDLVFGLCGLLSFGHAAFFGAGAYTLALLTTRMELSFFVSLCGSMVVGAVLALFFGKVALRASGIYFGLITLALSQLVDIILTVQLQTYTGGHEGITGLARPADIAGVSFANDANYVALIGVIFIAVLSIAAVLRGSPLGQVLRAARQNEVRAEQLGWNVRNYRLAIFVVSGAYVGLAGGLLAGLTQFVGPATVNWHVSGDLVIMTLLGGRDFLFGPVFGVIGITLLREVASSYTEHVAGILGTIFILCTLFMPSGIAGVVNRFRKAKAQ